MRVITNNSLPNKLLDFYTFKSILPANYLCGIFLLDDAIMESILNNEDQPNFL